MRGFVAGLIVCSVFGAVAWAASPGEYRDGDLNRIQRTDPTLVASVSIEESELVLDRLHVPITILRNPALASDSAPIFYFVMHDEENEAFDALIWAVANFGGIGLAVENRNARNVGRLDLNSLFGKQDRPQLNEHFAKLIRSSGTVIALHNNLNYPAGEIHLGNKYYFDQTCDAKGDVDDILITGQIGPDDPTICSRSDIREYLRRGLNVGWAVYQDRRARGFDCTRGCNFQRFVVSHFGVRYFNLEAEHRRGGIEQKRQLCAVLDSEMKHAACTSLK